MKNDRYFIHLTFFLITLLSGCTTPMVVNPLVKPEESQPFPELYGLYRTTHSDDEKESNSDEVQLIHLSPAGENYPEGFFRIAITGHDNKGNPGFATVLGYGFAVKESDYYLVHLACYDVDSRTVQGELLKEQWNSVHIKGYLVLRIKRTDTGFELAWMNSEFIEEALKTNQLEGRIKVLDYIVLINEPGNKECLITEDRAELSKFVRENIQGDLFESFIMEYKQVQ